MNKNMYKYALLIISFFLVIPCVYARKEMVELDGGYSGSDSSTSTVVETPKVSCGNITEIPKKIPELTSFAVTVIQIAVPVILVVMGSMDLFKGITAQKEDEIKKGQQMFVKRLIVGALIFFVVVIAKLLISVVADASSDDIIDCVDCFLSNECD